MKAGDLVKFVGDATFYKGRVGVVCKLYSIHNVRKNGVPKNDSALVYFAGAENQGRDAPRSPGCVPPRHHKSGLHPMALNELEVVNEGR